MEYGTGFLNRESLRLASEKLKSSRNDLDKIKLDTWNRAVFVCGVALRENWHEDELVPVGGVLREIESKRKTEWTD